MIKLRIPINQTFEVVIGDIYVNVNLSFKPMIPPTDAKTSMMLSEIESRLNLIGYKVAAQITNEIQKELESEQVEFL